MSKDNNEVEDMPLCPVCGKPFTERSEDSFTIVYKCSNCGSMWIIIKS